MAKIHNAVQFDAKKEREGASETRVSMKGMEVKVLGNDLDCSAQNEDRLATERITSFNMRTEQRHERISWQRDHFN